MTDPYKELSDFTLGVATDALLETHIDCHVVAEIIEKAGAAEPKLFRWRSDAFKAYARGHIIVVAASVEEARSKVRKQVEAAFVHHFEWLYPETYGGTPDEFELEERAEKLAMFEADIAGEPEIVETLFIKEVD